MRAGFPHPNLLPVGEGTADKPCLIDPLQLAGNAKINGEGEGGEVNAAVRLTRLAALVAALLLVVTWSAATVSADSPPPYEPGTVLVRWGPSAGVIALDDTVTSLGAWPVGRIPQLGIVKLRVPPGTEQAAVAALRRAGAQMAGLNHIRQATFTPNDTFYGNQWDLSKINAPSAWDITTGSSNIIVAVVDTGIDTSHPDLPQNLIRGADYTCAAPDYICDSTGKTLVSGDLQGHGTHVSGIIAARMNNGAGVAGVAPGTTLMTVRVLDAQGNGNTYNTALGITYAADHGAKIINLSLSGFDRDSFEEQAVNYAYGKGVLVVAAAGNEYRQGNPIEYPAALDHVVAVAATETDDSHSYYSEEGSYVDLAAPGGGYWSYILSTCISSDSHSLAPGYCGKVGTSMAAPHVAGVAALVWSINPSLTPDQVEAIMRQSAVDLGTPGRDDIFGYGRVDAYQAVRQAQATLGYAAQYVSQSFPVTMTVGQQFTASVQLKNTGGTTWQRGGANPMRLGASNPIGRTSSFYTAGKWVSLDRPADLDQNTVAPGQVGSFTFVLTAPANSGTFTEYFQPVVEGRTWLDQPVVWFNVQVSFPPLSNKTYLPFLAFQASGW